MPRRSRPGSKDLALKMYAAHEPMRAITAATGAWQTTISNWARGAGILRSRADAARKYEANLRFFQKIDSECKAYWLGFIYADGCVHRNFLQVSLARKDRGHLQRFLSALESAHPIRDTDYRYPESSLKVVSGDLVADLGLQGVLPRKTYSGEFPKGIPDHLVRHFVRGVFDGDGWILLGRGSARIGWVGGEDFLSWVASEVLRGTTIRSTPLKPTGSPYVVRLVYCGNRQVTTVRDWMFDGATVWLPRKAERLFSITTLEEWPDTSSRRRSLPGVDLV